MTRVFDFLLSLAGLVLGAPVLTLLWVLGWFDTGAPLFRQRRVGRNQKPFTLVKFRTMRPDTASVATHLADASAVTNLGHFLRRSKLDELPQLWNVLKGDMSLVGPRPERPEIVEKLEKVVTYYRERENLLPGLTGWAQIRYPYGATIEDARAKLEFDLYYLQNVSAVLDLKIILRTLRIVVFGLEREIR
jgi:lipopolysaccharide/colanic/teichoic acid biosynthesis glycosyltransferase